MKSPVEWNALLRAPRGVARPLVVEAVKAYLDVNPRVPITTHQLVEQLYPEEFARGENLTVRKRLYDFLLDRRATDLDAYFDLGEPVKGAFNRMLRRRMWHAKAKQLCPHCNGELP